MRSKIFLVFLFFFVLCSVQNVYAEYTNIQIKYIVGDFEAPTYSENSTNTTLAYANTEYRLLWNDNYELDGYNFSLCNGTWNGTICTGGWQHDSWVAFPTGGIEDWSNITKSINVTVGTTVAWYISANDTFNNWNTSDIFTYVAYPENSCTYLGFGNWVILGSENCVITVDTTGDGSNLICTGSGQANVYGALISNFTKYTSVNNCKLTVSNGGRIT